MHADFITLLTFAASLAMLSWIGLALHPARPWDMRPDDAGSTGGASPDASTALDAWPAVCVIVPARNEAQTLPVTLPALAAQVYPGAFRVLVVDDRSTDGTSRVVRNLALPNVSLLEGQPLPPGWMGKMWALHQGFETAHEPWVLLTDADIFHSRDSLRALVAHAQSHSVQLVTRMARLRCHSRAERWLVPAFVWFFNLLYPMRWVNDPKRRVAAAAGGCALVRCDVLERAGAFTRLREELIDDVNLGRSVKSVDDRIDLRLSVDRVRSVRAYRTVEPIWAMVRRSAFTQLGRSWLALAGTLVGLCLLFVAPPVALVAGIASARSHSLAWACALTGGAAWVVMAVVYAPALRFYGLSRLRALGLPAIGVLYACMTLDSAFRGPVNRWR